MTILNEGVDKLFHSLLPAGLRKSLKPNTAIYIRTRALTLMLVLVTSLSALHFLVLGSIHLFISPALLKHDLVFFIVLLMLGLQTGLFYRFNNYWASALAFTNFYFLVVILLLIFNGGYESHGISILLTCPIISFSIGSRHEGIQNALISIVFFWVLVLLHSIGFGLPNIFSGQNDQLIFGMNWIFSAAVIAITLMVYETELQSGETRLRARRIPTSDASQRIEAHMHALIPAALRQTLVRHSLAYVRAQILTIVLLAATFLGSVATLLIIGVDLAFHPDQFQYDITIVGVPLCFALQTWLFYKINSPKFSGTVLGYFVFLVITGVVLVSGGYDSPIMVLMLISPVGFFMINGMRDGALNAIVIAIIGVVLGYLKYIGFESSDFFHDAARPITAGIAWPIAIIAIMVCMMTYDSELEKL